MYKKIMYNCIMYSKELIKGTLRTVVISLLKDGDKMYGYEITQKVKVLSGNKILITEGALYPMLHKLEAEGVLETETQQIGKRVRKYYRLTKSGKNYAEELIAEFNDFMQTMGVIVSGNINPNYGAA